MATVANSLLQYSYGDGYGDKDGDMDGDGYSCSCGDEDKDRKGVFFLMEGELRTYQHVDPMKNT